MRVYFTMILGLMLFATTALFSQAVFYTEDFANGNLQNTWYPGFKAALGSNAKTITPKMMTGNPSGDNWVGRLSTFYSITDTIGVAESYSGDLTWRDYYVEAWMYIPVDAGPVSGSEYFTLEFRVDSTGNTSAYQFAATFNPDAMFSAPGLRFRRRDEGSAQTIQHWDAGQVPGGIPTTNGWHKLAVYARGNQFWFYYDDQEMPGNPYSDPDPNPFTQGAIGVYAFRFDFFNPSSLDTIDLIIDDIVVRDSVTAIYERPEELISGFELHQNYPNPFNPGTNISFYLSRSEFVNLTVYNPLGQKIRDLAAGRYTTGTYEVQWDGRDNLGAEVPGGVYFYKINAGKFQATRKMLLLR